MKHKTCSVDQAQPTSNEASPLCCEPSAFNNLYSFGLLRTNRSPTTIPEHNLNVRIPTQLPWHADQLRGDLLCEHPLN
jgi:hypothetical protein